VVETEVLIGLHLRMRLQATLKRSI
jgi:hypothetical protein